MARVLKEVLGLPVQPIPGYKGTADIRLAAESGEIGGGCWQWESIKVIWRKGLETGDANLVLQLVAKPHPELPKIPLAVSLAKTDEARTLLQAAVHDPNSITRPYSLPPGTPKDRVKILQMAFMDTMRDPEFLADAKISVGHRPGIAGRGRKNCRKVFQAGFDFNSQAARDSQMMTNWKDVCCLQHDHSVEMWIASS